MSYDDDYIDPAVLKRRAAASGGAGVQSSRPRVRRGMTSVASGGIYLSFNAAQLATISIEDVHTAPRGLSLPESIEGLSVS